MFEDKIPKAAFVQKNCERVITAEMAEGTEDLLTALESITEELVGELS
jgi:hypothetical protein